MVSVPVAPDVLRWAREERGLSLDAAARKLGIAEDDLRAIEIGPELPTLGLLQRMATRYEIALASLLMPAPLPRTARHQLHDFRAFGGQKAADLAPETLLAIEEANEYVDVLHDIRNAAPDLIPAMTAPVYRMFQEPEHVAQQELARLNADVAEQFASADDRQAFLGWRELVESQGVFVYQIRLGHDDSRGFAIWDEREVPAIVVDASEGTYGPKSFTIWHEYAHILLRMGGISNQNRSDRTERFCNQFASAFLMPRVDFTREARLDNDADVNSANAEITRLARKFKVSKTSVALRLEDLGVAGDGFYSRMIALWGNGRSQSGGRANHEQRLVNRLGAKHIDVVLAALDRKVINKLDAFEYTRIKPQYFGAVRDEIAQRRAAYGRSS